MTEDLQVMALLAILDQLDGPIAAGERPALVAEALTLVEELLAAGGGSLGPDRLKALRDALRAEAGE